jgi:hypothetical protein
MHRVQGRSARGSGGSVFACDRRGSIVLRTSSTPMVTGRGSAASRGVIVETIQCAADLEIAKLAASSRIVRLVRNAAHAIKMRCASEHDHGRPRRGSGGRR